MPPTQTVDASLPNANMQFCCNGLTLSGRKISTSTYQLETEIIFSKKTLHEPFYCIVRGWHLNSAQNIYKCIRRIIALSKQIANILKCVECVNSNGSFKSVKCYIIGS